MANSSIKNLNIDGNVVISGSTTSIDVATVTVDDKHIELNAIISPDDSNASGGGIIIKGTTDKVFSWINSTNSWTSDRDLNIVGTDYKIDNVSVINATTLGSSVISSSLTSVGTLGSLQVNDVIIAKPASDNLIGLGGHADVIKLESTGIVGTVTIDGGLVALTLEGEGSSITGISTANIDSPGTNGQILYSDGALGWGGYTSVPLTAGGTGGTDAATARTNLGVTATGADATYATVANNLSDLANAATARTNIGVTATGADTTYATVANNLGDLTNATTARTNLGLGSTNNPTFGGEGLGVITITATPSNSGTVAPTFGGTVFKNIPVTALSGHKWVTGIEQDGDLVTAYFTIDDTGANTSASETYLLFDPTGTKFVSIGDTNIQVWLSNLSYPTADGTAGQFLTTDGAGNLNFASTALLAASNLSELANTATARTNLGVANTDNIAEGTNEYWTTSKFDTRFVSKSINSLADVDTTGELAYHFLQRNGSNTGWHANTPNTDMVQEATNLYYTDGRADTRIALQVGSNLDLSSKDTGDLSEGTNLYYTDAKADARIVNAGSANWDTAYTDTSTAAEIDSNNTLVKRGSTGNFEGSKITANNGIVLGGMPGAVVGAIQWTGTDFQGYDGTNWVSLSTAAVGQISGNVGTFLTTHAITGTTYADVPGYLIAVTVTTSTIINVQVNVDTSVTIPSGNGDYNLKLVRDVGGSLTDLYIDDAVAWSGSGHFNITYADIHGQENGTVITYKLMAKVDVGTTTLTINPDATNAQIFAYELSTNPLNVTSVNGLTGSVILDSDDLSEGSSNLYFSLDWGTLT